MSTKNYRPDFVFIIPTLTNARGLENVLKKISEFYPGISIVVVNNSGWPLKINAQDNLKVLDQGRNTGFAKACNDGAKWAINQLKPKYLIFSNDDIDFKEDWVKKGLEKMSKNKWVAATPVLRNSNGEIENAGYFVLPQGKVELNKNTATTNVDGLTAAALIFDSAAFQKLKGFDEAFFAYLEDVDLFLRARKFGYAFGVDSASTVFHQGQATSSKFKTKKAWLDFKNWIRVVDKNWSREDKQKYRWQILVERGRNLFGVVKSLF